MFGVWKENWPSVQVFTRCTWTKILAGDRLIPTGIESTEIEAVCRLRRIPPKRWPGIVDDVRLMESIAGPALRAN